MLVYVNSFRFESACGTNQIIELVAQWIGQRSRTWIDPKLLAQGVRELRTKDGSIVSARATVDENHDTIYPYVSCVMFSHADDRVTGRRWTTEVGLRRQAKHEPLECTILLKTDEVSARVTVPIQVTRPRLVQQLVEICKPVGQTPGLHVKRLDEESARAFLSEVERPERHYPIVVISVNSEKIHPVLPERLKTFLVGLADVVEIPAGVDTYALQELIGRRYIAFGGAINIIFPPRRSTPGELCETALLRPEMVEAIREDEKSIESEVLAAITHRTNLPYSWRHISMEVVGQAVLRAQLARMIDRAKHSDELAEYGELLEQADFDLRSKEQEIEKLRGVFEQNEDEVRKLEAQIESLRYALTGRQTEGQQLEESDIGAALAPLRTVATLALKGEQTLEQSLELVRTLYPDRMVVLDSALDSARESDRAGFRLGAKALMLLIKLATDYWETLEGGGSDQQARSAFGQSGYSAKESGKLSAEGRGRRTFDYLGRSLFMEKHLKHGVKDSLAETVRIHFDWLANEQKIVIGHCGKHLDF